MPPVRRTTARKSVAPRPATARKCSMSNSPAASNDDSWGSELEKALAFADSQPTVLPSPGGSSVASDVAVKAPTAPDDIALEDERGEGISEARAQEDVVVARDNAVSVPSSACSAEMKVSLDEIEVRRIDCGFPESREDNVLHDGGDQVVVDDDGGKEKKVVKKMVKVVKQKVKMKVLKKVPKVGIRETIDSVAENLNPNSIERVEIQPVTGISVQLNHQNSNSGTRGIESSEKDGSDTQVEQVKGNVLMEVDQKGGGYWSETGNRVVQEHTDEGMDVEKEKNGECGHENEEFCGGGDEGAEEQGRDEEVGDVGRLEEEEEKLVSGELEAMDSRKRKTEIFIGGLDEDAKEEDVRKIFPRAGEIVNLTVAKDAKTGKNKGHAFVRYATVEEAKKALENFSAVKILLRQNLPQDVMCDLSRDEENVRHVKEHHSEIARETLGKAAKMKFHTGCDKTLSARTNIAQPSTSCIILVDSIDGSRTEQIVGDKSFFACSSDGKWPSECSPHPPPKRNKSTAPTPQISSQTGLGITPLLMVNHKEKVKRVKELYDQCTIPCHSNELSSEMAGQEEEDMHASRSTWLVREGREASTVEAPDPVLSADYSVLSSTALKARVVSLEKQRLDALIRAFKAKEAQTKAEKSKNALEKQLQAKKDEFKALKKKHKDEIKHLQRKHKAALKKAEDWGFKKGKRYQLDLMKEALAFFDAEFRFEDFIPSLDYIENDRKKSVEAAVQQVRLEAEQFASQSKDDKPLDTQNVLQTSLLFGNVVGEEEGVEEQEEGDEEEE